MTASRAEIQSLLDGLVAGWVVDEDSPVVYTEVVEDRRAVRMRQETRDFTTVWFWVGDRSVKVEAYVVPAGEQPAELLRQCMVRNRSMWRLRYCLDEENGIVLRGRVALDHATELELGYVMAEIYEQVEISFRPLVRALTGG